MHTDKTVSTPISNFIAVRFATRSDLLQILKWLRNERRYNREGFFGNRGTLRECADRGELLVMCLGDQVIGFSALYDCEIRLFEIKPSKRRRGYGSQLAEASIDVLRTRGCDRIRIECEPFESLSFWKAQGFDCSQDFGHRGCLVLNEEAQRRAN